VISDIACCLGFSGQEPSHGLVAPCPRPGLRGLSLILFLLLALVAGAGRDAAAETGGRTIAPGFDGLGPNPIAAWGDRCIEPCAVPMLIRASSQLTGEVDQAQTAGSTGYLDVAAPALSWIDGTVLGWLPVWTRVILWAALASLLSMAIYRLASRQETLAQVKAQVLETRAKLQGFEGEFDELWPILRRNLGLAGKQLGLTFLPAMIAGLPVLLILAWMANAFDARSPAPGETLTVTLTPAEGRALPPVTWQGEGRAVETAPGVWSVTWPTPGRTLRLENADGTRLLALPTTAPVRTVAQREWWNPLIGNPGGYLPSPGDVAAVHLNLPQPTVLPFGPDWLRGWLPTTLLVLVVLSLFLKIRWRLH
jgi:hypothetical protein